MSNEVVKVKRKRVDWWKIVITSNDPDLIDHYFKLQSSLYCGRPLSKRRCAYNALRSYYSTTTIAELMEKLGL